MQGDELMPSGAAAEVGPGGPVVALRRIFDGFAPPVPAILSGLDDDHPVHIAIIEEVGLDS